MRPILLPDPSPSLHLCNPRESVVHPVSCPRHAFLLARLDNLMFKPKRQMLGGDLFGTVEAVGPGVTLLAVPAEVPTIGTSSLLGFDCMFILDSRI